MDKKISSQMRRELVEAMQWRYHKSPKTDKTRILNEFVALTGYHRKHGVRLLNQQCDAGAKAVQDGCIRSRRVYDEAVKETLTVMWETSDRICGKRLKAILPELLDAMERHGHLSLDPEVRSRTLRVSAATIDRLLKPIRSGAKSRRKRRRSKKASKEVPVRTFADWGQPDPGYLEVDFVVHCGVSMAGSFVHTLVATDVCSGWTEFVPLLAREQSLVVEGLEVLFNQIPFRVLGIDSDNDSAFINETLLAFCRKHHVEFTRSRAYHKNDQAWVEQKNGAVVRRLVGYERFSGVVAAQALAHLYQAARLYVNYFQPSFKLRRKERHGAKVRRIYEQPATPCKRLLRHLSIDEEIKTKLRSQRVQLDPVRLLHRIREGQAALAALVSSNSSVEGPGRESLDQFLAQLPQLWQAGEVRPTHRAQSPKPRHWRTRKNPFETVWYDVLRWLQESPETTAKDLFKRLKLEYPGRFADGQLRTLQRRVREWRQVMARKLVFACMNETAKVSEIVGASGMQSKTGLYVLQENVSREEANCTL
jgi:hypothetical protein